MVQVIYKFILAELFIQVIIWVVDIFSLPIPPHIAIFLLILAIIYALLEHFSTVIYMRRITEFYKAQHNSTPDGVNNLLIRPKFFIDPKYYIFLSFIPYVHILIYRQSYKISKNIQNYTTSWSTSIVLFCIFTMFLAQINLRSAANDFGFEQDFAIHQFPSFILFMNLLHSIWSYNIIRGMNQRMKDFGYIDIDKPIIIFKSDKNFHIIIIYIIIICFLLITSYVFSLIIEKSVQTDTEIEIIPSSSEDSSSFSKSNTDRRIYNTIQLYVDASALNLRRGPGTSYDIIESHPKGTRLEYLGDFNGE